MVIVRQHAIARRCAVFRRHPIAPMTEKQLTYVQNKIAGHTVQECVVLAGYRLHKGQEIR